MAECEHCAHRRSEPTINAAAFPAREILAGLSFDANPNVDPAVIHTLAASKWVNKGLPLCLIGGSATGKSHLLIAFATRRRWPGPLHHWPRSWSTSWWRPPTTGF
jgi:DNA replication protein DnaC